jgi:hypothetical protein
MFCDITGKPDPNGDYELVNGSLVVRDGRSVRFDRLLMDSAAGARTFRDAPPSSIDESLKARFVEEAKKMGEGVKEWLSKTPQSTVSAIAAEVAEDFVRQHAQEGTARQFSTVWS